MMMLAFALSLLLTGLLVAGGDDALAMGDGAVLARIMGAAGDLSAANISVMSESSVVGMLDPNA